jgi:hypothetical protein
MVHLSITIPISIISSRCSHCQSIIQKKISSSLERHVRAPYKTSIISYRNISIALHKLSQLFPLMSRVILFNLYLLNPVHILFRTSRLRTSCFVGQAFSILHSSLSYSFISTMTGEKVRSAPQAHEPSAQSKKLAFSPKSYHPM